MKKWIGGLAAFATASLLATSCLGEGPDADSAGSAKAPSPTRSVIPMEPSSAPAARSGSGGSIVATFSIDNDLRLFTLRPDGGKRRLLVDLEGLDFDPSWSPDAARVVFRHAPHPNSDAADIYTIRRDGTGLRNLTKDPRTRNWSPAWSPDGRWIAFASQKGSAEPRIWVMHPDGTARRRLTAGWGEYPAWSPDSKEIAFMSRRDGNYEIYRIDITGRNETRLTETPEDDRNPAYGPDGRLIAFDSERDSTDVSSTAGSGFEALNDIYVMAPDGSAPTRLTFSDSDDTTPVWTPAGLISFGWVTCEDFTLPETCSDGVAQIDADGTGLRQLGFPYSSYDWASAE